MKADLTLRLMGDGSAEWLDPVTGKPVTGALSAAPAVGQGPITVLVPGEDVLVSRVEIAARQRQRLLQAIPYALEDQLMDEVDVHHFALGEALDSGAHLVAAVATDRMNGWLEALQEAGIEAARMVPDTAAVPRDRNSAVVVLDGARALLRSADGGALAAGRSELDVYLGLLEASSVKILGLGDPPLLSTVVEREALDSSALAILTRGAATGINLRQGAFARDDKRDTRSRRVWVVAAVFAALAIIAETGSRAVSVWSQASQADAIEAEIAALLTSSFPEIGRVVDARIQMQQSLEALRGGGGTGALALLRLAGPALAGDAQVRLESMTYRQGTLLVEVRAADLRRIEAVRQRLVGRDLAARIESANTLADSATARIRIGMGS